MQCLVLFSFSLATFVSVRSLVFPHHTSLFSIPMTSSHPFFSIFSHPSLSLSAPPDPLFFLSHFLLFSIIWVFLRMQTVQTTGLGHFSISPPYALGEEGRIRWRWMPWKCVLMGKKKRGKRRKGSCLEAVWGRV